VTARFKVVELVEATVRSKTWFQTRSGETFTRPREYDCIVVDKDAVSAATHNEVPTDSVKRNGEVGGFIYRKQRLMHQASAFESEKESARGSRLMF
jgi:hypothetical protein